MGVAFADYDGDGFTDVFVSNDTFRNFLFHNNGNGTFSEMAIVGGVAYNENGKSIAGMGTDFRDFDNNGWPDIFVVGMIGDTFPLFRNTGKGFWDITSTSGVARATVSRTAWGAGIADFDNDRFKDLFGACAAILDNSEEIDHLPSKLPKLVLRNLGNGHFADASRGLLSSSAKATAEWRSVTSITTARSTPSSRPSMPRPRSSYTVRPSRTTGYSSALLARRAIGTASARRSKSRLPAAPRNTTMPPPAPD
ncbi:MAG: hypothetical protein DMG57_37080 [Acidobacteria bacterium]|nr:MAG: hypothetical protein DMG57_37080 [Acidobacteriota bacterium]